MATGYVEVLDDPYELRATGLTRRDAFRLMFGGGLLGLVSTLAVTPALVASDGELAALPMSGILLFGVALLVAAYVAGYWGGASGVIISQPKRIRIVADDSITRLEADRRMFVASDVQRVEFHLVPMPDGEQRFFATVVFPAEILELVFVDPQQGAQIAATLHQRLGCPGKPIGRDRPMFRAYGCLPALVILLAICGLMWAALTTVLHPPASHADLWPAVLLVALTTGATYGVSRMTAASTARQYVQKEYGTKPQ